MSRHRPLQKPSTEPFAGETADALNEVLAMALERRDYDTSARLRGQLRRLGRASAGCHEISPPVKKRNTRGGAACLRAKLHAPQIIGTE